MFLDIYISLATGLFEFCKWFSTSGIDPDNISQWNKL